VNIRARGGGRNARWTYSLPHEVFRCLSTSEEIVLTRMLLTRTKKQSPYSRHGSECVKAVQACEFAHMTSRAAEELLAYAPSAPHVMMRLRDATLRATAFKAEPSGNYMCDKMLFKIHYYVV